jgi:UV excision repair protein RAD23
LKISSVKQKIAAQTKGETDKMKLICKGKVLTDEQTVEDFGIVEGDFLVLMVVKAKAGGSSSAAAAAPTSTAAPKAEEKPKAASAAQAAPAPSSTSSSTGAPAESLLKGKELEDSVQSLVEMGYSKEEVLSAMRKAYNNPHRAFEYLASGMAGGVEETAETQGIIPSEVPLGEEDHAEIAGMEGLPNLDEIRQLVQQQPQLLEPLLQQLAQTNPDIVRAIQQNPEAFLQYLSGAAGAGGPGPEGTGQGKRFAL